MLFYLFLFCIFEDKQVQLILDIVSKQDKRWRQTAFYLTKCKSKADDIIQEMYLRLHRNYNKEEITDYYVVLLINSIFNNSLKDKHRTKNVYLSEKPINDNTKYYYEPNDKDYELIRKAGQLTPIQKELLEMTYDYSLRQIASQSKTSHQFINKEVTKARKQILGEELKGYKNKRLKSMGRRKGSKNKPKDILTKKKGVGDIIEDFTTKTGIKKLVKIVAGKDCGCEERKNKLNELPLFFRAKLKPKCLDPEEIESYKNFIDTRTLKIREDGKANGRIIPQEIEYLCEFWAKVFNRPLWKPDCYSCKGTADIIIKMVRQLDHVYYNEILQIEIDQNA